MKDFLVQIGEATDCSCTGHLITYVLFVKDTEISEHALFYKHIKTATASDLLKIVDDFMKEKGIKL
jgi:hypothetical protein